MNPWLLVLDALKTRLDEETWRRWFSDTSYAADSGDQITVWVSSEVVARYLSQHFGLLLDDALTAIGRPGTIVRFIVGGYDDEDDELDEA